MVKNLANIVVLAIITLMVSNCGSKGPLYLPPKPASSSTVSSKTASGVHTNDIESANIKQKTNSSAAKTTESLSITTSYMKAESRAL